MNTLDRQHTSSASIEAEIARTQKAIEEAQSNNELAELDNKLEELQLDLIEALIDEEENGLTNQVLEVR
jgi:protein subunit release factor A